MSRSATYEGIVLKTYNVGEADRFCIIFTKEIGRLSARSNGVRKLHSKLGPSLLPGMVISVQLRSSKAGNMVSQTQLLQTPLQHTVEQFTAMQILTETLIALLPEEQELPEIYEITKRLLGNAIQNKTTLVGGLLELLWQLGYTPAANDPTITKACTKPEAEFIEQAMAGNWHDHTEVSPVFTKRLLAWINNIVMRESGKPLNSIDMMLV